MGIHTFVGRNEELALIREITRQNMSKLVVINGRRRIGKSTLALKAGENCRFLNFSGLAPVDGITARDQLGNFANLLAGQLHLPRRDFIDWHEALSCLSAHINPNEYTVILFDEISWMETGDKLFVSKLKVWWDTDISTRANVLLIFCGSVSTWIQKNIINSTSFFGRIAAVINLSPLSLADSTKMLRKIGFRGSTFEVFKILSVTGGVPWYLEQINSAMSADQNIAHLCFRRSGILFSEYEKIFNDLFARGGDIYGKILLCLSSGAKTLANIREETRYLHGGTLGELVNNLVICGFVSKHNQWSLKTKLPGKQSIYRICDPYIRFYLKYIKPNKHLILNDHFLRNEPSKMTGYDSFMGFQIESLLLQNRNALLKSTNISEPLFDNPYIQKPTAARRGCQVDYLVQTRTNNLYVCEFKFRRGVIGAEILEEMQEKMSRLYVPRGMAVIPVLFHIGGVTASVNESNFFYGIVDISDLLEDNSN
jgi:AAA+ ATPase superfamily predicted ATPase